MAHFDDPIHEYCVNQLGVDWPQQPPPNYIEGLLLNDLTIVCADMAELNQQVQNDPQFVEFSQMVLWLTLPNEVPYNENWPGEEWLREEVSDWFVLPIYQQRMNAIRNLWQVFENAVRNLIPTLSRQPPDQATQQARGDIQWALTEPYRQLIEIFRMAEDIADEHLLQWEPQEPPPKLPEI